MRDIMYAMVLVALLLIALPYVVYYTKKGMNKSKAEKTASNKASKSRGIVIPGDNKNSSGVKLNSFSDIGGLRDVKEELKKYVAMIGKADELAKKNIQMPVGLLLYGPPGCGKTSLAKAIANEAGVPFICENAANIVERNSFNTDVGGKIGKLFDKAREMAPCILFIDEVEVFGSRFDLTTQNKEEITRLLSEMDGFQDNSGVLVIGATNNISNMDMALLRSGRFGKKYHIGPPISREDVLEVVHMYTKGKDLHKEVNDEVLVSLFSGMSPADIKETINICAVMANINMEQITADRLRKAKLELKIETNFIEQDSSSYEFRKIVAMHEAGHAIVAKALGIDVDTITVLGTSTGARGITSVSQFYRGGGEDGDEANMSNSYCTLKDALKEIVVCYGGVAADRISKKDKRDINMECIQDVKAATTKIFKIVYGMTCLDDYLISFDSIANYIDIRSDDVVRRVQKVARCMEDIANKIMEDNEEKLTEVAERLVQDMTISGNKLNELLSGVKVLDDIEIPKL